MRFRSIHDEVSDLAATVDHSLETFAAFLAAKRNSLHLGDEISTVLSSVSQLRRHLARLFRMQSSRGYWDTVIAASPAQREEVSRLLAEQENFRLTLNAIEPRLSALRAGEQANFATICDELEDLVQRIVAYRKTEKALAHRSVAP